MALHLEADLKANYDRFVSRVRQSGVVWALRSERGFVTCPSNHKRKINIALFWSDEPYAKQRAARYWPEDYPVQAEIEYFIEEVLPQLKEHGLLVGVNYNEDLAGLEIDPIDLAMDLQRSADLT